MGLYDREYYRDESRGFWSERSMVTNLLLINIGIFLVDSLFAEGKVSSWMSLESDRPWKIWEFLTYGFAHTPMTIWHVGGNMFMLWMFGRDVEGVYGRTEFLRLYLTLIIASGLVWLVAAQATPIAESVVGASGAVMGIFVIFVCHFPHRQIYIWGILPIPAWVLGVFYVLMDLQGLMRDQGGTDNFMVAHTAHLGGAVFGYLYYRTGWNLGRLIPRRWSLSNVVRPRLRIHDPEEREQDLNREVDRILEKISREGEASLTKKERRILEDASRRYQRKRH